MATQVEFIAVTDWLTRAIGKPIADDLDEVKARLKVYYECLGRLPATVLMSAARRVAISHPWQTFPNIGELAEAAFEVMMGTAGVPSFAEAWRLARNATLRMSKEDDPYYLIPFEGGWVSGSQLNAIILARLPPLVALLIRCFGFRSVDENDFCRGQFERMYTSLVNTAFKHCLLTGDVDHVERLALPPPKQRVIEHLAEAFGQWNGPPIGNYNPQRPMQMVATAINNKDLPQ
jgi:hypothetical protein